MGCVLCLGTRRNRLSASISACGRPNYEDGLNFQRFLAKSLISIDLIRGSPSGPIRSNSQELGEKNHLILLRGEMPQLEYPRRSVAKCSKGGAGA